YVRALHAGDRPKHVAGLSRRAVRLMVAPFRTIASARVARSSTIFCNFPLDRDQLHAPAAANEMPARFASQALLYVVPSHPHTRSALCETHAEGFGSQWPC